MAPWTDLVSLGTRHAMAGLSEMIGQEIGVSSFTLKRIAVAKLADEVGGPEADAVGIYLTVSGAANGHLMLIYEPSIAYAFVDLLMDQPVGTTQDLDEMGRSALGEMGNIIGAFFLNAIADATGLALSPSPPAVMMDMTGALLDVVTAQILMSQDDTYLAETTFLTEEHQIEGQFMVIPSEELLEALLEGTKAA
jgi:chemotaxis protein CheC